MGKISTHLILLLNVTHGRMSSTRSANLCCVFTKMFHKKG